MKHLRFLLIFVVILLGVTVSSSTALAQAVDDNPANKAAEFLQNQLQTSHVPAAAYAMVSANHVIASGAVGQNVTTQTPFLLGSLSKSFTALAVMQLVDQGKVDLDSAITRYIPWFRTGGANEPITVRQFLDQSSGLPTSAGRVDLYAPETTLEERVRAIAQATPTTKPGTLFQYCNKNYATLGLMIQLVSGESYASYITQHIFTPLGMNRSFTDLDAAKEAGLIEGATVVFGLNVPQQTQAFPGALPDGYLISTAEDLTHYLEFQMNGNYNGVRLLSDNSLKLMHTATIATGSDDSIAGIDHYAFGWGTGTIEGKAVVEHDGELTTYHSNIGYLPESHTGLIVLGARNPMLLDNGQPFQGALTILAGGSTPSISYSYLITYAIIDGVAVLIFAAMVFATVRQVRRGRKLRDKIAQKGFFRAGVIPLVGNLIAAGVVYSAVFFGIGMLNFGGMLPIPVAYYSLPDITITVLVTIAFFTIRGLAWFTTAMATKRETPEVLPEQPQLLPQ